MVTDASNGLSRDGPQLLPEATVPDSEPDIFSLSLLRASCKRQTSLRFDYARVILAVAVSEASKGDDEAVHAANKQLCKTAQ